MVSTKCRCGKPRARSSRVCLDCHAAYMRRWRVTHRLSLPQRRKASARRMATVYQSRGALAAGPCEACGAQKAQNHHEDYSKPLEVRRLCRPCHLAVHGTAKAG
jgi:hypothetical protein